MTGPFRRGVLPCGVGAGMRRVRDGLAPAFGKAVGAKSVAGTSRATALAQPESHSRLEASGSPPTYWVRMTRGLFLPPGFYCAVAVLPVRTCARQGMSSRRGGDVSCGLAGLGTPVSYSTAPMLALAP